MLSAEVKAKDDNGAEVNPVAGGRHAKGVTGIHACGTDADGASYGFMTVAEGVHSFRGKAKSVHIVPSGIIVHSGICGRKC